MSDDEIICLDSPKFTNSRKGNDHSFIVSLSDSNDSEDPLSRKRNRDKAKLKPEAYQDILSTSDDISPISSPLPKKKTKNVKKAPCKIKLPKRIEIKSPLKSPTKKKKTLADIVTDIHETSTDEIDSDEISASQGSQEQMKLDQPCCSKTIPQISVPFSVNLDDDDDEEEDLPNIDDNYMSLDRALLFSKPSSASSSSSVATASTTLGSQQSSQPDSLASITSSSSSTTKSAYRISRPPKNTASNKPNKTALSKQSSEEKEAEKRRKAETKRIEATKKKEEENRAKELRKVTSELQRSVKPGESIKHMVIILDSAISSRFEALTPQFVGSEIKYNIVEDPAIENSITFKRELMRQAMGDDLQVRLVSKFQDESEVFVLLDSEKAVPMIHAQLHKNTKANIANKDDEFILDLVSWVESIKSSCSEKKLTLLIYDLEKYFRKIKKNTQQDFRKRILNAGDTQQNKKTRNKNELPQVSQTEIHSSLVEMQLHTGVNYRMIKNVSELASTIIQYTKAIADAPFKKERIESQGFDWFALSDSAGSIKVEKDGSGLKKLWIDQLQQFTKVGTDVATAIANRYNSPLKLIQAYDACKTEAEGQSMLKDLTAITGTGPLARNRKVGVETSKKMYRFFTSTNGDRFLGSTQDSR